MCRGNVKGGRTPRLVRRSDDLPRRSSIRIREHALHAESGVLLYLLKRAFDAFLAPFFGFRV